MGKGRPKRISSLAFVALCLAEVSSSPPPDVVELRFAQPAPSVAEWLAIGPDGLQTVGSRPLSAMSSVGLERPPRASLLRVRRRAKAPWTLDLTTAADHEEVIVPPGRPGGELLVVLPGRRVLPSYLLISGPSWSGEVGVPESRVIERNGLAPGSYAMSAGYAAGKKFGLRAAQVEEGTSTELVPLELPEVGAVELSATSGLCSLDAVVVLGRDDADSADDPARRIRTRLSRRCSVEIAGLVPGSYFATLEDESGDHVFAGAEVRVRADHISESPFVPVDVRVVGRAHTHRRRPVGGAQLQMLARFRDLQVSSSVDGDGTFSLRVPATGTWDLSLGAPDGPELWFQRVHLQPGDNPVDIETLAAGLRLSIRRTDGKAIEEPVDVSVKRDTDLFGRAWTFQPDQLPEVEIYGLNGGRYSVYAATPSGLYSPGNTSFELSDAEPTAQIDLVLEEPALTIHLKNARGEPVRGELAVGPMTTYSQRTLGVFMLPRLPRGEPMQISPRTGLAICRRVPAGDELDLTVRSGDQSLALLFPGRKDWPYVQLEGLPESDCPVGLEALSTDSIQQSGGRGELIKGLPAGRFTVLTEDGQRVPVNVPGPPVTILPAMAAKPSG